ncbi:MAG: TadE/TadG family type IV pilus assembly protein [Actinomycetota bacterium]
MPSRTIDQSGQATLELALCLPLLALVLAALVEVGLLVADQARLWHAAREAARVGVVDSNEDRIEAAAERVGLSPLAVEVSPGPADRGPGEPLTVRLTYRPDGRVPLIGELAERSALRAEATMRIELP